jgi:flavin reductase (DIM6/NTAB) family NADH-FMN oxidoreductase RutF
MSHRTLRPPVLYFGTPVALVTTMSPDGTDNIGPMSSVWCLGYTAVMGWEATAQTLANLQKERECVINLPGPDLVDRVEALAPLTGRNPPAEHKADKFRYEPDKFGAVGLTRTAAKTVRPPRIAECPLQLEATVSKIHKPLTEPDGDFFRIVEAKIERVHALPELIKGDSHVDTERWSPLLYVFRHYFGSGEELGETFRADD